MGRVGRKFAQLKRKQKKIFPTKRKAKKNTFKIPQKIQYKQTTEKKRSS
jgi:hypothetical protein